MLDFRLGWWYPSRLAWFRVLTARRSRLAHRAPSFPLPIGRTVLDTFYGWLCLQTERTDTVGVLARFAVKDKIFPRQGRKLSLFLQRFDHTRDLRDAVKLSHAEWRKLRRKRARREH